MFKTRPRSALIQKAKRLRQRLYRDKPIEWQIERFNEPIETFKWSEYPGYENHSWDGTPDPFYHAINALSQAKWVGIESATGTGKTYMLPRIIFWFLDVFPDSLVVTTAPKKDQLKEILWKEMGDSFSKFKRIRTFAEMITLNVTVDNRKKLSNISKNLDNDPNSTVGHEAIGFVSSVGAGEESATKMQGFHREYMLFVLEECAGIPPAVIKAIENTSVSKYNLVIAVGNPDNQLDALHQFCEKKNVEHIVISAYDHPNVVLNREVIPGAVTTPSIKMRRDEYGEESNFYKSRVRGIAPTEGVDSLIRQEFLDQCTYGHKEFWGTTDQTYVEQASDGFHNAIGVDVANSIDGDKAALCFGYRNVCTHIMDFQCPNASHLAYNLMLSDTDLRKKEFDVYNTPKLEDLEVSHNHIGVDAVGVGVSTVNTFRDHKIRVIALQGGQLDRAIKLDKEGKPLYRFSSLRAQMYFQARVDLQQKKIILHLPAKWSRMLAKELTNIRYFVRGGAIYVEDKEEIKKKLGGKSPNLADAFVYWNWMKYNWYGGPRHLPFG